MVKEQTAVWISTKEKKFSNVKLNESYSKTTNEFFDKDIVKQVASIMGYSVYWE